MNRLLRPLIAFAFLLTASVAQAQLTIEIIGGGATQTPIAVVPFAGEADFPLGITGVVGADLQRSGLFKLIDSGAARPATPQDVRYPEFRSRGAEAVVVGSMTPRRPGQVNVRFFCSMPSSRPRSPRSATTWRRRSSAPSRTRSPMSSTKR